MTTISSQTARTGGALKAGEVARLFHVAPSTVWRWTKEGKLSYISTTSGGHRRYRAADVQVCSRSSTAGRWRMPWRLLWQNGAANIPKSIPAGSRTNG